MSSSYVYENSQQKTSYDIKLERKIKKYSKTPFKWIPKNIITDKSVQGPFGEKELIKCDFATGGNSLKIIEEYLNENIIDILDDAKTTSMKQIGQHREIARQKIKKAINDNSNTYSIIFTEYDLKYAIEHVVQALGYTQQFEEVKNNEKKQTIVFISSDLFSRYGKLLKELNVEVTKIASCKNIHINIQALEVLLKFYYRQKRQMLAIFSVASKLTGSMANVNKITSILHQHSAISFWDYSTAGPYVNIDMNPNSMGDYSDNKDIVFLKPNAFVGGYRSPSILIIKNYLIVNRILERTEAGFVAIVSDGNGSTKKYVATNAHPPSSPSSSSINSVSSPTTPDKNNLISNCSADYPKTTEFVLIEPIRAGFAVQLKYNIGDLLIENRAKEINESFYSKIKSNPKIKVLGDESVANKLPIFSLMFYHEETNWAIHHNFICILLRDLFGIKCATGILTNEDDLDDPITDIEALMFSLVSNDTNKNPNIEEIMKIGVVNFTLPFYLREDEIIYITDSINLVSQEGWKLLPLYKYNMNTGSWKCWENALSEMEWTERKKLQIANITDSHENVSKLRHERYFNNAQKILKKASPEFFEKALGEKHHKKYQSDSKLSSFSKQNRWFMTPQEALSYLRSEYVPVQKRAPVNKLANIYKRQNAIQRNQLKLDSEINSILEDDSIPYKRVFEHNH